MRLAADCATASAISLVASARRPPVPIEAQAAFVPITETTPAALSIDACIEDPQLEFDLRESLTEAGVAS